MTATSKSGYSVKKHSRFIDDIFDSNKFGNGSDFEAYILDNAKKKHPKLWESFEKQGIDFRGILESDIGTITAEKGYDAILAHNVAFNKGVDCLVLLNRTKLVLFDKKAQETKM